MSRVRLLSVGVVSVMASLTGTGTTPANAATSAQPKLLVTILVDGLDENCLRMLRPSMGPDGFNRLINGGLSVTALDYGSRADAAAAAAMLLTGAGAAVNSVPASEVYDTDTRRPTPSLHDPEALGNFTSQTLSPQAISVSTLADELRINGGGSSRVHSVAIRPEEAIILSGHAGNTALWIDATVPRWATTTYYKETPAVLTRLNYGQPLAARLDTMRWTPSSKALALESVPESKRKYSFSYTFPTKVATSADAFMRSPKVNSEVTQVALSQLESLGNPALGTDMLGVTYTLSPYPYSRTGDTRLETYDAYLRLDSDIASILNAADKAAGPGGSVIMLAALPPTSGQRRDDEQWRVPGGKFSPKKAVSLLNMYLMAVHGSGEWVSGYHDRQFYLNTKLAEDRKVNVDALRQEAAQFLTRMSGVRRAETIDAVLAADTAETVLAAASGDVFIDIIPGWEIEQDSTAAVSDSRHTGVERALPPMPLYILAPGVTPRRIDARVDARRVAPTVAGLLRIRSPGAASEPPLPLE
ncbi:MAG: alkaline phosphatase family protein [Candidatus Amulumruptor caecigallinarius]|nr:alkaline phosphatase family protein [Candidatus Amulumruptor caecigallinarius]MCM1396226.1 alkaline phosphatase family protein [Candidatus Amulumruptor caecigallinarius]MCM1453774.1 alkaline phosphatase family protein [bacterium]